MGGESGAIHDGMLGRGEMEAGTVGELLLRVANLVGEIEALKRERTGEQLSTRLEFASAYFQKRRQRAPGSAA
jgi:uncharacterized small protein (DUF1192 family)